MEEVMAYMNLSQFCPEEARATQTDKSLTVF